MNLNAPQARAYLWVARMNAYPVSILMDGDPYACMTITPGCDQDVSRLVCEHADEDRGTTVEGTRSASHLTGQDPTPSTPQRDTSLTPTYDIDRVIELIREYYHPPQR